jgi:hypothetical protein
MNRVFVGLLLAVIAGQMMYWAGVLAASGHYWGGLLTLPGGGLIGIGFVRAALADR